jgi:hypothetical protein
MTRPDDRPLVGAFSAAVKARRQARALEAVVNQHIRALRHSGATIQPGVSALAPGSAGADPSATERE